MPFCIKCGQPLAEGAKFCSNCGTPVEDDTPRQQVFEGELRKCPHCGAPLKSFEAVCSVCGYELRGVKASKTTQQLAEEIAQLERTRPKQKEKPKKEKKKFSSNNEDEPDEIDKSIANLIQTFPIPNSKEDVIEFIVLAMSNADTEVLDSLAKNGANWAARNIISEAWISKLEQAYQKAKILFGESPEFTQLQAMYERKQTEIKKGRKKASRENRNYFIGFCIFFISVFVLAHFAGLMADKNYVEEEAQRLEGIYSEVQVEISNGNYEVAFMKVNNLYYIYRSDDEEYHSKEEDKKAQEWDTKREILLREIERAMNEVEEGD